MKVANKRDSASIRKPTPRKATPKAAKRRGRHHGLGPLNMDGIEQPTGVPGSLHDASGVVGKGPTRTSDEDDSALREIEQVLRELEAQGVLQPCLPVVQRPETVLPLLTTRSPTALAIDMTRAMAWLEYIGALEARFASARGFVENKLRAMYARKYEEARERLGPMAGRIQLRNGVLQDAEYRVAEDRLAAIAAKVRLLRERVRHLERQLRTASRQVTVQAIEQQALSRGAGLAKRRVPTVFGGGR